VLPLSLRRGVGWPESASASGARAGRLPEFRIGIRRTVQRGLAGIRIGIRRTAEVGLPESAESGARRSAGRFGSTGGRVARKLDAYDVRTSKVLDVPATRFAPGAGASATNMCPLIGTATRFFHSSLNFTSAEKKKGRV